jgi:SAM-dependent methyltransferase
MFPTCATGLDYNGIGAVSDLHTPPFRGLFEQLERDQQDFDAKASSFLSAEYRWPQSRLDNWSRAWEYPYVYHALDRWRKTLAPQARPVVADVGSGVTFFPFSVARLGCRVVCTDIDPVCQRDLARARKVIPHAPGDVDFRLAGGVELPFGDGECDAVYSISVLEHIPDFEKTVAEIARILKPDGFFALTCDLDLRSGGRELGAAELARLNAVLDEHFSPLRPTRTIHPNAMLTTHNSPLRTYVPPRGPLDMAWRIAVQKLFKPLVGRKPGYVRVRLVSVLGLTLTKGTPASQVLPATRCHGGARQPAGVSP